MIAAYALLFGVISIIKYRYYLYNDIDLALFAQALDRLLHGSMFSSIRGMNWLGDHSSFVLFLLAPIYAVFRHPVTLLLVQTLALALGAIPVYRIARRTIGSDTAALLFAAIYLAYPAVGYTNLFEFHPETLCTTTLLFTFDALLAGQGRAAFAWAFVSLLGKEDVALVVLMAGLWSAFVLKPRQPRLGAALGAMAIASLVVSFGVLKPHWNAGEAEYARMYGAWGATFGEVIAHVLRNPLGALQTLFMTPGAPADSQLKAQLHLQLLLPLAFLPLLRPLTLLLALPVLAAHLLSGRIQQHTIVFQYTALVTPAYIVAAIEAAGWIAHRSAARGRNAASVAAGACLISQACFGPFTPWHVLQASRPIERLWPSEGVRLAAVARDRVVARLHGRDGIVAGFELLSHFANRANVHSVHHVLSGRYTFSTREYPKPHDLSGVVADYGNARLLPYLDERSGARLRSLIDENGLQPVDAWGDLVLFARDTAATPIRLIGTPPSFRPAPKPVLYDHQLLFAGVEMLPPSTGDPRMFEFATYWVRDGDIDRQFLMQLVLADATHKVALQRVHPLGYSVYPPSDWPIGRTMAEAYRFVVTSRLTPGPYTVRMRLLWQHGQQTGVCDSEIPELVANGMYVDFGSITIGPDGSVARY